MTATESYISGFGEKGISREKLQTIKTRQNLLNWLNVSLPHRKLNFEKVQLEDIFGYFGSHLISSVLF